MKNKHLPVVSTPPLLLLVWILAFGLSSCARMQYVPVERVRTVIETVRDTVVEVRLEKESVSASVRDTSSHLETRYASSDAVYSAAQGVLRHSLTTRDTPVKVLVKYVDRHITDSVPAPYPVYVDRDVVREKPVRLPLRWWERAFFWTGVIAVCAIVMYVAYKLRR